MNLTNALIHFRDQEVCPVNSDHAIPGFVGGAYTGWGWARNRIGALLKKYPEATRSIPHNAVCFFKDGTKWACVYGDFVDLQQSPAGFGDDFMEAFDNLKNGAVSDV